MQATSARREMLKRGKGPAGRKREPRVVREEGRYESGGEGRRKEAERARQERTKTKRIELDSGKERLRSE